MDHYMVLGRIGEGAHGIVLKARHQQTGEVVALKKVPLRRLEGGIPNNILREIKALQHLDCIHVVRLLDTFPQGPGVVLVFEYMISDLAHVLKECGPLREKQTKKYMQMLLKGVTYCHDLSIMHRDLKPANLLISSNGCLKIADFGLCRVFSNEQGRLYSHQVATRWYRAPELLYGAREYDEGMDLWAIGCIFGEMVNNSAVFPGENDIDQLGVVLRTLGKPTEETWPGHADLPDFNKISFPEYKAIPFEQIFPDATSDTVHLLKQFLVYPSKQRIAAKKALLHPYFFTEPVACPMSQLPVPSTKEPKIREQQQHVLPLEEALQHLHKYQTSGELLGL